MEGTDDEREQELAVESTTSGSESSDELGAKARRARSLANLRPAWRPGASGNPSGLSKDGGGTKDHPLRATLRAKLAKRRAMERLVDSWIDAACDGDSAAREQILKRLDPITEDATAGRVVLESIKLELTPGGAALTMAKASASSSGASFVVEETSESRAGGDDDRSVPSLGPTLSESLSSESQGPMGPTASS